MKNTILKIATITILAAAIAGTTNSSRAEDTTKTPDMATEQSGPAKFYGPVTAVDTNAMTFTVGDQTFAVTSESQLTKGEKPATLADAVVGEPARGSYTKGSDGKLDVTKARFGKKSGGKAGGKSGGKKKKASSETATNAPAAAPQN